MYNFQIDMTALQHRIQHFYLSTARYHTCDKVVNYQSNLRTPSHFIQNCPQYDAVWGQKDEKFPSTTTILKGLFPFLCVLKDLIYKKYAHHRKPCFMASVIAWSTPVRTTCSLWSYRYQLFSLLCTVGNAKLCSFQQRLW